MSDTTRHYTQVAIERGNAMTALQAADMRCCELEAAGVGEDDAEMIRLTAVIAHNEAILTATDWAPLGCC